MDFLKRGIASVLVFSMLLSQLPVTVVADMLADAEQTETVATEETVPTSATEETVPTTVAEETEPTDATVVTETLVEESAEAVANAEPELEAGPEEIVSDELEGPVTEATPAESEGTESEESVDPSGAPPVVPMDYVLDENGILTISGDGGMGEAPWLEHADAITTVILEEGVASICDSAFYGCTNLTNVFLPNSLRRIGASAFSGCTSLGELFVPPNVTKIDSMAFNGCTSLRNIRFSGYDLYILDSAFTGVSASVRYPYDAYGYIGSYGGDLNWMSFNPVQATGVYGTMRWVVDENGNTEFYGFGEVEAQPSAGDYPWSDHAKRMIWLTVSGVENIPANAFAGFSGLHQVTFDGISSIGEGAFSGCDKLKDIYFLGYTDDIAADAFAGVRATVCVEADDGWTAADYQNYGGSLSWAANETGSYGDNIVWELMGEELMIYPMGDSTVTMENQTSAAGYPWYIHKDRIRSVILSGVSAGDYIFDGYTNLFSVMISEAPAVGAYAFRGCSGLTDIRFSGKKPATIADNAFTGVTATATYYEGNNWNQDDFKDYGGDLTWKVWTYVEPEMDSGTHGDAAWTLSVSGNLEITGSGEMAPANADGKFGWSAYKDSIRKVTVEGLTSIADGAFAGCSQLEQLKIGASVTKVGSGILKNTAINEVEFLGAPPVISETAFEGLEYTTILYPYSRQNDWMEYVDKNYGGTEMWWSVMIQSLDGGQIGDGYWNLLENGNLHIYSRNYSAGNPLAIPDMAAGAAPWTKYASQICEVSLTGVSSIGSNAFAGLSALQWVYFQDETLINIGNSAFAGCTSITYFSIPKTVKTIGEKAFAGCTGLQSFSFEGLVESIAADAFSGVKATAWYPLGMGWTEEMRVSYGGELTWDYMNMLLFSGWLENTDISWDLYGNGQLSLYGNYENNGSEMPDLASPEDYPWHEYADRVTTITTAGIVSVGDYAFADCVNLESFRFSLEIKKLGNNIFEGCTKLSRVIFDSDAPVISENAFCGVTATVYWPTGNETWAAIAGEDFGGNLDWGMEETECQHDYVLTLPGREPGCIEPGLTEGRYCGTCGETLEVQGSIPPLDHNHVAVVTGPTCEDSGYTTYTCSRCGDTYTEAGEAPLGHTEVADEAVDPGCVDSGLTAGSHCSVCGKTLIPQEEIPPQGHFYETMIVEPTCTEYGYIRFICIYCEDTYTRADEEPLGHNFVGGSCTVCGEDDPYSGTCGQNVTWSYDRETGTLTISGTGPMEDYSTLEDRPWDFFAWGIDRLIVEEGVTTLGKLAFQSCINLMEITLPAGLTKIGASAFEDCDDLYGLLEIPESVTEIGDSAFRNCRSLTALTLSGDLKTIGNNAFEDCAGLTGDLVIPDSVTSIGSEAFMNCCGFDGELTLPENLKTLGSNAFQNCSGFMGTLTIPDQVTEVKAYTFSGMSGISSLVIGAGVTNIYTNIGASHGFYNMNGVENVTFKGLTPPQGYSSTISIFNYMSDTCQVYVPGAAYRDYALAYPGIRLYAIGAEGDFLTENGVLVAYCGDGGNVTVPEGITTIGYGAFRNCHGVTSVTLPDSVETIQESAFEYCVNLTTVTFPEALKTIGTQAFNSCRSLTEAVLPEGLTAIGEKAFYHCSSLENLILPETVTVLEPYAFSGCENLQTLELPGSLERIGNNAFHNCSGLTGTLVIPDEVSVIGGYAFSGCVGLTELKLGRNLQLIEHYAFQECTGLTGDLVIPNGVTTIGESAFGNCVGFDGDLVLSENLIDIRKWAFVNCGFTGELVIPDTLYPNLHSGVFAGVDGITELTVGAGITNITTSAHESNHSLSMEAVEVVNFRGLTPPAATASTSIFAFMPNLKRICVPAAAFEAYVTAYSSQVPENVVFVAELSETFVTGLKTLWVHSRTAAISWEPHISKEVVEYRILVDGQPVGTAAECSFRLENLTAGREYTVGVVGRTADGRETAVTELQITTLLPAVTDLDAGNAYNKIGKKNTLQVSVANNGIPETFEGKQTTVAVYYLNNDQPVLIGEAQRAEDAQDGSARYTLHWDVSAVEDGEYTLLCRITDVDGTVGEYRETFTVDKRVPKQLNAVTAVADITRIYVNWGISWEADTTVYRIYRRIAGAEDFALLAQIEGRNIQTYADETVEKDVTYEYYVVGVNTFDQDGEPSQIVSAILVTDEEAPVITNMVPQDKHYLSGKANLSMQATDNLAVVRTALYVSQDEGNSWTLLKEADGPSVSAELDTNAFEDGVLLVKGLAWDAMANESAPRIHTYCVDNTGPEQIKGLAYESTHVTMTLRWEDVADQDISFFRVEQKNSDGTYTVVQDVTATLGVNLYGLEPNTEYVYRVVGYDLRNNRGVPSEDIRTRTQSDTTPPAVTALRPLPGYYADTVPVRVTAGDEFAVAGLRIQVSRDTIDWADVHAVTFQEPAAVQTVEWPLDLTGYEEGNLYVRAVVTDTTGNESDSGPKAPYVQYIVDRTAPAAPANVTAEGFDGYVEIRWEQGTDSDVARYEVFRAEGAEGAYVCVASNVEALNWFDRNVSEGITYSYQVAAYDAAGNRGGNSVTVSAEIIPDREAPTVISIYPNEGSVVGGEITEVSAMIQDNGMLESVTMEYGVDGGMYHPLKKWEKIGRDSATVWTEIPLEEFQNGETVNIRVYAEDASGNVSSVSGSSYLVDNRAPAVTDARAAFEEELLCIRWTGGQEKDLAGYQIYRSLAGADSWQLVNQYIPDMDSTADCFCYDYSLPMEAGTYQYKVEALDQVGNSAFALTQEIKITSAGLPDTGESSVRMPKAELYFDPIQEAGKEYIADASDSTAEVEIETYLIDFGDGTTAQDSKSTHIYAQPGTYDVTLWVTDNMGNMASVSKPVEVREPATVGILNVKVRDEHGSAVPGASVYFDLGGPSQIKKRTDNLGCVQFTAEAGRHVIGALIANNEWLPAKATVIVTAGETTTVELTMVKQPLVEGTFEVRRMTYDEIIAADIDPTLPDNQHIIEITLKLTYAGQELEAKVAYNKKTGESKANPLRVLATDGIPRKIIPVVMPVGGPTGSGDSGGTGGAVAPVIPFPDWLEAKEKEELRDVTVAYLDVPVEASFLKEFFDVRLHIMNNSSIVSMLDNLVTLNVPEGLSLVEGEGVEKYNVVNIPKIPGNSAKTLAWILRGDKAGSYDLSADYTGRVSEFNENIRARFETQEPLTVNGLNAVKLVAEFNSKLYYDGFYFNLGIENTGDTDIYLPSIGVTDNVISTYAKKAGEVKGLEPWEVINFKDKNVSHYNTILRSTAGFSQQIGKEAEITRLAPGERLVKQFVVYNATGLNNRMHLQEAVQETAQSCGVNIEILESDMDLFPMDDPVEKFDKIFKGGNISGCYDMYKKVTDPFNYLYVMQSVDSNTRWSFEVVLEGFYKAGKILWEFDKDYNEEDTRKIARKIVAQLLQDESMQQAIRENEEAKYLKIAAEMFAFISSTLGQMDIMDENYVGQWKDFNESGDNIQKLAQYMMGAGEEGAYDRFCAFMMSHITNVSLRSVIMMICDSSEATGAWMDSVSKACKPAKELMSLGSGIYDAWNDSLELTQQLIQIAAAEEEAEALLEILIKHTEEESCIYKELEEIKANLKKANKKLLEEFIKRAGNIVLTQTKKQITKVLMENMDMIWKGNAAASGGAAAGSAAAGAAGVGTTALSVGMRVASVYAAMGMVFSASDYLFGFEKTVEDLHIFRVCTAFAFALRDEVTTHTGTQDEEEARRSLRALKYLIKMHLLGEEYFTVIYKDDDSKRSWSYEMLNGGLSGDYNANRPHVPFTGMEDYYSRISEELLTFRDGIFGAYYTDISIPAAPVVSLNLTNCRTNESFTSLYEYSYDGSTWEDCTGETIPFVPGVLAGSLWVRVKGTGANPAGNITKVVIPGQPLIQGSVTVLDIGDQYAISGLPAGSYYYQFTDERSVEQWRGVLYAGSGATVYLTDSRDWTYLALQTVPREGALSSAIRYVVTEDLPAQVSTEAMIRQSLLDGAKEIRIDGEVTLRKSLTIPAGVTLVITGTGSLTLPVRMELINHGTIRVYGSLTVGGKYAGNPAEVETGAWISAEEGDYLRKGQLVTSVSISGEDMCSVGRSIQLTAEVLPLSAWDKSLVWSIASGTDCARIEPGTGKLTGLAAGEVTVQARTLDGGDLVAEKTVTIINYRVEIKADTTSLAAGNKLTLTADLLPTNYSNAGINWAMEEDGSQYATLTVNRKNGTATLTANTVTEKQSVAIVASASDGKAADGRIVIDLYPRAEKVQITRADRTDVTGQKIPFDLNRISHGTAQRTMQLYASTLPESAGGIAWKSSSKTIATVDQNGFVVFTGKTGTVKITASATDGSKASAVVTIEVVSLVQNIVLADDAPTELTAGGKATLSAYAADTEGTSTGKKLTAKQIRWSLAEEDAPYATITADGKLTARKVLEKVTVTATGSVIGNEDRASVSYQITILPQVTQVELLQRRNVRTAENQGPVNNSTVYMSGETLVLQANTYPLDAENGITWSVGNLSKYAEYQEDKENHSLIISNPNGKVGTITIKATAKDSSRKAASVKVVFGIFADTVSVYVMDKGTQLSSWELVSGKSVQLTAKAKRVQDDRIPSNTGVTWSLENPGDEQYVTLSQTGKVTAKKIYEKEVTVAVLAVAKDGSGACGRFVLTLKPENPDMLILKQQVQTADGAVQKPVTGSAIQVETGKQLLLGAWGLEGVQYEAEWTSGNGRVAAVEQGVVNTKAVGTATISAVYNGQRASVTVKVVNDQAEGVRIAEDKLTVASGKTLALKASVEGARSQRVTWSILSGNQYAKLTSTGTLTAAKDLSSVREVVVRATAADGSGMYADATVQIRPVSRGVQICTEQDTVENNTVMEWDMETGKTLSLRACVFPYYADDSMNASQLVKWTSSARKVATVDANGVVTCLKPGTTTITAVSQDGGDAKATFTLTVVKRVNGLSMAPQMIAGGKTLKLASQLTVFPKDTSTRKFQWAIAGGDGMAYASISSSGTLTTKKVTEHKQVRIRVTAQDSAHYSKEFVVDIYPATTKVSVQAAKTTIAVGETLQLVGIRLPDGAADRFTWKSSGTGIASVDENGLVTGISRGTVTITCTAADGSGKRATVRIKVT